MTRLTATRLLDACASIPPIRAQNLLPVVIMLGLWVMLRTNGVAEDAAFVVSVVTAQAYLVWRNLPVASSNLKRVGGPNRKLLNLLVGVTFLIALLQLWLGSPLFTQRLLTMLCTFFLVIMGLGILREREVMEKMRHALPAGSTAGAPISLMRVNATVAAMVIAVNEWLIFYQTPGVWITLMPLFMLALHGIYWIMVLLTLPSEEAQPPAHGTPA